MDIGYMVYSENYCFKRVISPYTTNRSDDAINGYSNMHNEKQGH